MNKKRVRKLQLDELSFVDNPACPQARILLVKRAAPEGGPVSRMLSNLAKKLGIKSSPTVPELTEALEASLDSIHKADLTDEERQEAIRKTVAEFNDAIVDAPPGSSGQDGGEPNMDSEQFTKTAEALQKRLDETVELAKRQAEELKKLRDKDENRERLAKAQSLIGRAPVSAEDVATLLKQLDADGEKVLTGILSKTSALVKEARLFDELGSRGEEELAAEEALEKKAEEIRKSDSKLTFEQAYTKAVSENPELYEATLHKA